ncbi:MAG: hypothetical protein LRY73_09280 [Bacillus sp. (in: Bacteria)]|nr:hypothetical protein [Bacillus sp. (in: firmicutes)]
MVGLLLLIIFSIPMYWAFIYGYLFPEESILWGRRWMYEDEPQLSDAAILLTKYSSLLGIIILSIVLIARGLIVLLHDCECVV